MVSTKALIVSTKRKAAEDKPKKTKKAAEKKQKVGESNAINLVKQPKYLTSKAGRVNNPGLRTDGTVKISLKKNVTYLATHTVGKDGSIKELSRPRPIFQNADGLTCGKPGYVPVINSETGRKTCRKQGTTERIKIAMQKFTEKAEDITAPNKALLRKSGNWLRKQQDLEPINDEYFEPIFTTYKKYITGRTENKDYALNLRRALKKFIAA